MPALFSYSSNRLELTLMPPQAGKPPQPCFSRDYTRFPTQQAAICPGDGQTKSLQFGTASSNPVQAPSQELCCLAGGGKQAGKLWE